MSSSNCRRFAAVAGAVLCTVLTAAPATAADGPVTERRVSGGTFADDFLEALCGVTTETTFVQKEVHRRYPDGRSALHVVAEWTPADRRLPVERYAFTDHVAPDGTVRTTGLAIAFVDQQTGKQLVRDTGWVRFDPDGGYEVRGPHPFLEMDPAAVYCGGLA